MTVSLAPGNTSPATPISAVATVATAVTTSATPGTATTALAANPSRKYLALSLPRNASASVWFSTSGAAAMDAPSIEILPGGYWSPDNAMPTGAVSIVSSGVSIKLAVQEG